MQACENGGESERPSMPSGRPPTAADSPPRSREDLQDVGFVWDIVGFVWDNARVCQVSKMARIIPTAVAPSRAHGTQTAPSAWVRCCPSPGSRMSKKATIWASASDEERGPLGRVMM